MLVHQYVLEYPLPPSKSSPLQASLKVERFAVAQPVNTTAMIYRPDAFAREAYKYHRWRVSPGYLATDYLARDLRGSGLFKAVFSYESSEKARFVLEGGVEDFQEVDEAGGWKASLALIVTLLDTEKENVPEKVVFQKSYRTEEPMVAQTPRGLAESMSRAMEKLSAQIITDVYQAAQKRLQAKEKK
jgi:cholesterol transport system auxiliary component